MMTEQEKLGALEWFETFLKMTENQDNSTQFREKADQLLAAAGNYPLPYINAAAGELEKVGQAKEAKAKLIAKLTTAIDFIKSTPAEELSNQLVIAQMDKA